LAVGAALSLITDVAVPPVLGRLSVVADAVIVRVVCTCTTENVTVELFARFPAAS
jgi:hypothetical protein